MCGGNEVDIDIIARVTEQGIGREGNESQYRLEAQSMECYIVFCESNFLVANKLASYHVVSSEWKR